MSEMYGAPGPDRRVSRAAVSPPLRPDVPAEERKKVVPVLEDGRSPVLVEVDMNADVDTQVTRDRFRDLWRQVLPDQDPAGALDIADNYVKCVVTPDEVERLFRADQADGHAPTIFRIWPDYTAYGHIDRSVCTIKSDAAQRSYGASGQGVVWAVLDSGIDRTHPHFACGTFDEHTRSWSKDFTHLVDPISKPSTDPEAPFQDPDGHGTHVAGIIAGRLPAGTKPVVGRQRRTVSGLPDWETRQLESGRTLAGVAPDTQLVSLRVLTPRDGQLVTSASAVIEALYYLRTRLNDGGRTIRVDGANLSLGCDWDPDDYAAGQSPLCREVDLTVGSGTVVVVSAGNNGSPKGRFGPRGDVQGLLSTITDPGNAEGAITVGSTHRDSPHRYGVTYTSSKGPTTDGRLKPDLLAPGERITSAATGALLAQLAGELPRRKTGWAGYIEDSGTSMAAPHVSGAIAAFLSVRPEFKGLPREVKEIFCANATSLGRDRYLEGSGLVDIMRVLSSV